MLVYLETLSLQQGVYHMSVSDGDGVDLRGSQQARRMSMSLNCAPPGNNSFACNRLAAMIKHWHQVYALLPYMGIVCKTTGQHVFST